MANKLLIIDPAELQPVNHLRPRQALLAALTTAHKGGWHLAMISDQSRIAKGERTLTEVLDYHQAAMSRYGQLIGVSMFTTNQGSEMVVTRCQIPDIGIFNTQSTLTQKIAKSFDVTITGDWFLPPSPGLLMACMALHNSTFKTTVMVGTGRFEALATRNGLLLMHPETFEQKGVTEGNSAHSAQQTTLQVRNRLGQNYSLAENYSS
ncbi:hypothetical protein HRE53_32740 (plasmid) [Acaryochloris sp. 'Moss Beach']|uniref:hypothetical protein n=1 Tax=Acaryochloris TaxID=155977 RepID=UPI001BAEDA9A|nr:MULTISPECIES: hypothetical protein [Acaryochloris]QUY45831.1 hypothetical protein I1H34_29255 [Acaryochloris marina S15]UJB73402.1 hypothetical protein HRE53_32740 [Acaryochloris sp. 'Moss Beach']